MLLGISDEIITRTKGIQMSSQKRREMFASLNRLMLFVFHFHGAFVIRVSHVYSLQFHAIISASFLSRDNNGDGGLK